MVDGRRRRLFLAVARASVVCFGAIGSVYAEPFPLEPYISITGPDKLDLSDIPYPGDYVFTPSGNTYDYCNGRTLIRGASQLRWLR